jgi:hypothetical protein
LIALLEFVQGGLRASAFAGYPSAIAGIGGRALAQEWKRARFFEIMAGAIESHWQL